MREHSGGQGGKNNNRNPTLRDFEREKGESGEAIAQEKKVKKGADKLTTTRP